MPIGDTTRAAQAIHTELQRAMTGERRLLLAFEMSDFARALNQQRIRTEHSDWSEDQVARELLRLAFLPVLLPDLR